MRPQLYLILRLKKKGKNLFATFKYKLADETMTVRELAVTQTAHKGCHFKKECCSCIEPAPGCLANNAIDAVPHAEKVRKALTGRVKS